MSRRLTDCHLSRRAHRTKLFINNHNSKSNGKYVRASRFLFLPIYICARSCACVCACVPNEALNSRPEPNAFSFQRFTTWVFPGGQTAGFWRRRRRQWGNDGSKPATDDRRIAGSPERIHRERGDLFYCRDHKVDVSDLEWLLVPAFVRAARRNWRRKMRFSFSAGVFQSCAVNITQQQ